MHALPHLRRRQRIGLHLTLVFLLLMQGAIPLQAHTRLAHDASGQVVVVCTWDGTRTEVIDAPDADPGSTEAPLSPACLFSQLLSSAAPAAASLSPVTLYQLVPGDETGACPSLATAPDDPYRIRAPPIIVQT